MNMVPLRLLVNNAKRILPGVRPLSAKAGPLVDLSVDNEGIATLSMQKLPVNSLNLELLQDIEKALDEIAKSKTKGMILTSSAPTTFSAGLDIMEMYKPDMKRAEAFWSTLQNVWLKLFGSSFVTAAAINGHAPAGGCLLAMSCEYRVMVNGKFSTGLNETALGIVATKWFMDTMCNTIPRREAEFALTSGRMFNVDEALKVGLIDEIATDKVECIEKCRNFIKKFDRIPPMARAVTKQRFRADALNWVVQNRQEDLKEFLDSITRPKVQETLEVYMQMLKKKAVK